MKIKTKQISGTLALLVASLILVGFISIYLAISKSNQVIQELTESRLESTLMLKKSHIEDYLRGLTQQFELMSKDQSASAASFHFDSTFPFFEQSSGISDAEKSEVRDYFTEHFFTPYTERVGQSPIDADTYFKDFTKNQWILQYHYITANPNPIGEKQKMESPSNEFSSYSGAHSGYHNTFLEYSTKLGFGDVYLIGPDGRINYSLKKGFELGTNIINGPFASSGLGRAFNGALNAEQGQLVFEDFSAYTPLFEAQAAFIATPIVKFKRVRGVIAVQFPIDKIDQIMTNGHAWKEVGFGETGEAYLVGSDSKLRNTMRLNDENPERYFERLQASSIDSDTIDQIKSLGSGIGLHTIDTTATQNALSGKSGFASITQQDGREVLSAYAPINVEGFNWAIISEIDKNEAFSAASALAQDLSVSLLLLTIIVAALAAILIWFSANLLFKPLENMGDKMHDIAHGDATLSSRLNEDGDNEISGFAKSFNVFVEKLATLVERTEETSRSLSSQANQLTDLSRTGNQQAIQQRQQIENIQAAISQILDSITSNAERANLASDAANEAKSNSEKGKAATQRAVESIQDVEQEITNAAEALAGVENDTNEVASLLAVIDSISEQTNLLALNAAIEAARAGENGRGFAVVADEVRSLSHKIQHETAAITTTVNNLKVGTENAVAVMRASKESSERSTESSQLAGKSLDQVVESSDYIAGINREIKYNTNINTNLANDIKENVDQTAQITSESTTASHQIQEIGNDIASLASQLHELVGQFSNESNNHSEAQEISK
ncbi:hypothetical protein A3715_16765 [Oleiphilus sp. HI0009]|nr:methyl-accepting chemotaxis protein [Oleiphilus sp. HI0067]KZX85976.1 hypothetical protein A3715_16765 [Oleiphilus sp. HI0009]KZY67438.1 hypothetical protein A3739_12710 [Oleiphilus sp. HI0067]